MESVEFPLLVNRDTIYSQYSVAGFKLTYTKLTRASPAFFKEQHYSQQ